MKRYGDFQPNDAFGAPNVQQYMAPNAMTTQGGIGGNFAGYPPQAQQSYYYGQQPPVNPQYPQNYNHNTVPQGPRKEKSHKLAKFIVAPLAAIGVLGAGIAACSTGVVSVNKSNHESVPGAGDAQAGNVVFGEACRSLETPYNFGGLGVSGEQYIQGRLREALAQPGASAKLTDGDGRTPLYLEGVKLDETVASVQAILDRRKADDDGAPMPGEVQQDMYHSQFDMADFTLVKYGGDLSWDGNDNDGALDSDQHVCAYSSDGYSS